MAENIKINECEFEVRTITKPKGWGTRHTFAFLGFCGFAVSYAMRFNLSLAIVAMVYTNSSKMPTEMDGLNGESENPNFESCSHLKQMSNVNASDYFKEAEGEFHWTEAEQGIILGSFFWGYVVTQLPGGIISQRYGGKWALGFGLLLTAVFALLTPVAARTHKYLLILVRIVQGLGEGLTTPAGHMLLSSWATPEERSILGSIVYAGSQFGTALTMILSGYLIHSGILGGWPAVFYVIGAISIVWFFFWAYFVYDKPSQHPRITLEELAYIEGSIGEQSSKEIVPTPWKEIFTSIPVWAIVVGHVGHAWGLYTLLTELPTYLKTVLHFDIKQNSWISALPYLAMWAVSLIGSQIADALIAKKLLSTVSVRKSCQTIAHIVSAIALIAASYSGCDRGLSVFLIVIAVGINGVIYGGYAVNHVDIAANHSAVLMGITNTFANFTGFLAPALAGALINNNPSVGQWQLVFFVTSGIYLIDVIFYCIFASATEQSWNRPKKIPQAIL